MVRSSQAVMHPVTECAGFARVFCEPLQPACSYHIAPGTGVVFFHGIKNMEDTKRVFDPATCAPRPDQVWTKDHYVQYARNVG